LGYSGDIIFMTWIVTWHGWLWICWKWCVSHRIIGESKGFFIFWATKIKSKVRSRSGDWGWIHQPHPATTYLLWTAADLVFDPYPCVMSWLNFLEDPKIGWETYWEDDQAALRLGWEYAQTTWGIWDRRSNKFCRSNLGTIHWQAPLSENEQWKWIVNPDFECLIVP